MTAGAAAARVVETIVSDAQNRARDAHQTQAGIDRHQTASAALASVQRPEHHKPANLPYDSPERRTATDQAMQAAGVLDEARHAKTTADLMNGVGPALAASAGTRTTTQTKPATKAVERGRGR